jgi:hypothetical protein
VLFVAAVALGACRTVPVAAVPRAVAVETATIAVPVARSPLAYSLVLPYRELAATSSSDLLRELSVALARRTDLVPASVDDVRRPCKTSIACLVRLLRHAPPLAAEPDLLLELRAAGTERGADRISMSLFDLVRARAALEALPGGGSPDERALREDAAALEAVAATGELEIRTRADTADAVQRLVEAGLKEALAAHGHWEPFGAIRVRAAPNDAVLELDGSNLGPGSAREVLISGLRPGAHLLRLSDAGFLPAERALEVRAGAVAEAAVELARDPGAAAIARPATVIGGLGLAGAGAVALASGAIELGASPSACVRPIQADHPLGSCPPFLGPPLAVSGAAAVAAGALTAAYTALLSDEDDVPWPGWVVGLAAGLAAGVGVALLTR